MCENLRKIAVCTLMLQKMAPRIKALTIFLRTGFYLAFFRQVKGNMGTFMGNLGKNPSHPQKFSCSYTYGERNCPAL